MTWGEQNRIFTCTNAPCGTLLYRSGVGCKHGLVGVQQSTQKRKVASDGWFIESVLHVGISAVALHAGVATPWNRVQIGVQPALIPNDSETDGYSRNVHDQREDTQISLQSGLASHFLGPGIGANDDNERLDVGLSRLRKSHCFSLGNC